jgi:uncharacterized protein involved in exopolysaccharide biosynthesis
MTNSRTSLTAGDVARSLFRHWKKAFAVFCLVLTATVCWIVFKPCEYESVAQVYVGVGHENNTLDPSATVGQNLNIQQTLESEVNSMLHILKSRETAAIAVDEIGVDVILADDIAGESADESATTNKNLISNFKGWLSDAKNTVLPTRFAETPRDRAIRLIQKRSMIWSPKKSNVIEISCKAGHPLLAKKIANAMTNAFIAEHLRVTGTEGSVQYFVKEAGEIEGRLLKTEQELTVAKSSAGLVSIEGQKLILEDQAKSIRTRAIASTSMLDSSRAKVEELKSILKTIPARVDADQRTSQENLGWYTLREKLFELQIREHEMKSKYSADKPEVIAVVKQRKEIEKILATQSQTASESISSPNPTYQLFQQALLNEQAQVTFLLAEKKSLENQMQKCLADFETLNENVVGIAELERKQQILETSYLASAARMEQAKILQGFEMAKISSVHNLQSASLDVTPTGLGRAKTLLLGIFLGIFLGGCVAAITEYFDRSFVTASQVENALDVPVLVSIPQGRRQHVEAG